jgi:dipeptidyl aminopeptidase/acylaminoacyl peptidase
MGNLETRASRVVLEAGPTSLSEASWSPQNQYLLFTTFSQGGEKKVFAVRFPKSTGKATGEWIPITDEPFDGDRARWSSDGKTVFYLSNRDGSLCIWARHFEPKTGKVQGPAFAVVHFHNSRISPETVMPNSFELSVGGDTVYLNLGEVSASIWTGVLKRRGFDPFLSRFRW